MLPKLIKPGALLLLVNLVLVVLASMLPARANSSATAVRRQIAKIRGEVLDSTHARCVGAKVSIESETLKLTLVANDKGEFVAEVPVGTYDLSAEFFHLRSTTKTLRVTKGDVSFCELYVSPVGHQDPWFLDVKIEAQSASAELAKRVEKAKLH